MDKLKSVVLLFCLVSAFGKVRSQNIENQMVKEFLDAHDVMLNDPIGPRGFSHFIDCDSNHAFRKQIGDTIILYSWGGAVAEGLQSFKKSLKSDDFNITRYPYELQDNGSIVMTQLEKHVFVWRRDTLFMWDDFNYQKLEDELDILDAYSKKKLTKLQYRDRIQSLSQKQYNVEPKFKVIYFDGLFKERSKYVFAEKVNFRSEVVELRQRDEQSTCIAFTLHSYKDLHFLLVHDEKDIEIENCKGKGACDSH